MTDFDKWKDIKVKKQSIYLNVFKSNKGRFPSPIHRDTQEPRNKLFYLSGGDSFYWQGKANSYWE